MSDKSKLGFNINPKNYDELNSTDNLITSGSDSGWLGKKLQGDNNSTIDLSKINPLFDKELYEKYRPGVNTNDGSVNQDIWGYKCFNSPVSFRNGIYGDTYSIHSIDTYEGDPLNNTKKNGIIIQPYNKQAVSLNNIDNTFRICNDKRSEQKDDKDLIYIDTRETHIQHSYTGKENQHNVEDVNLYDILKNTYIDGANTENISYTQSNDFPGNGEYSISFIQNTFDHCAIYSSNSTNRENAVTYNGINTFSNKKIDKQIGPFPYITTYNYKDFVNITSSIYYTNNIGTDEEPKHNYNISRITIGTECGNDPVIEKEITANSNCIRMYSADGTHGNSGYTNDNISSIIITPEIINTSIDNKIIAIDYHTSKLTGNDYNYSIPFIDITFDYTKVTDDLVNLIAFQINSLLNIQDATTSNTEDYAPSINVYGIFKNANSDIIKYRGTQITPTSITVNAIQFNQLTAGETFISNIHNKLVPVEYIFKQNDNDETGINTYGLKLLGCDSKFKTSFICDYLDVGESIRCKSSITSYNIDIIGDLTFTENINGHNISYYFNNSSAGAVKLNEKYYTENNISCIDKTFSVCENDVFVDKFKIKTEFKESGLFTYSQSGIIIGATDYNAFMNDKYRKPLMEVYSKLINTNYLMKSHRNSVAFTSIYDPDPDLIGSASLYRRLCVVQPVVGDIYRICIVRGNTKAKIISNITNIPTSTSEAHDINRVFLPGTILFPYIPAANATSVQELEAGYTYIITGDSRYTIIGQNEAVHNNYNQILYNKNNGGECYLVLCNDKDLLYEVIEPVIFRGDAAFVYCTIKIVAKKYAEYTSSMV